jgi:ABC-type sugar transport system substrate-binding protein
LPGSSSAQERHRGLHDALDEYVKVKEIFGNWKPEVVMKEVAQLDSLEEIDIILPIMM